MLFGRERPRLRRSLSFLLLLLAVSLAVSACSATKGSVVILESPNGGGFTMDFKEWSAQDKCALSLNKGDVLQIEIVCEEGEIALTISGKNGSEPYTGKNLKTGIFTVAVSETDDYEIHVTGKDASGSIAVKNLESA